MYAEICNKENQIIFLGKKENQIHIGSWSCFRSIKQVENFTCIETKLAQLQVDRKEKKKAKLASCVVVHDLQTIYSE